MQRVDGAVFYHLHKSGFHDDQWFTGNEIIFDDKRFNPYYDYYSHYTPEFVLYNQSHPIQALPASVRELQECAASLDFNIRELINLPAKLSEIITDLTALIREEIFEDVRKTHFPDRPSRKTCLFVCDDISLDYWKKLLNYSNGGCQIFRLSLTGIIFRANENYVHLNEYGTTYFRDNAVKYWQGIQGDDNEDEEILFLGKAIIKEQIR